MYYYTVQEVLHLIVLSPIKIFLEYFTKGETSQIKSFPLGQNLIYKTVPTKIKAYSIK